ENLPIKFDARHGASRFSCAFARAFTEKFSTAEPSHVPDKAVEALLLIRESRGAVGPRCPCPSRLSLRALPPGICPVPEPSAWACAAAAKITHNNVIAITALSTDGLTATRTREDVMEEIPLEGHQSCQIDNVDGSRKTAKVQN